MTSTQQRLVLLPKRIGRSIAKGFGFVVPARERGNTLRILRSRAGATEPKNKRTAGQYASGAALGRWLLASITVLWTSAAVGCEPVPHLLQQAEQPMFGARPPEQVQCYRGRAGSIVALACDLTGSPEWLRLYRSGLWLPMYEHQRALHFRAKFGRLENRALDAANEAAKSQGFSIEPHVDYVRDVAGWDLYGESIQSGMRILSIDNRAALVLMQDGVPDIECKEMESAIDRFLADNSEPYLSRAKAQFPKPVPLP